MGMRYLVTGANGFIGSWLAKTLLNREACSSIILLDKNASELWSNEDKRVKICIADLSDVEYVSALMSKVDICIHCALGSGANPIEMLENDVRTTVNLLTEAGKYNHKKFVYFSSVNAIGRRKQTMNEETRCAPNSLYSAAKLASEAFIEAWSAQIKLSSLIIRPGYTFGTPVGEGGSGQRAADFYRIVQAAVSGEPIVVNENEGAQFVAVEDLCDFAVTAIESETISTEIVIVAGDEYVLWSDIAKTVMSMSSSRSTLIIEKSRFSLRPNLFDIRKSKSLGANGFAQHDRLNKYLRSLVRSAEMHV